VTRGAAADAKVDSGPAASPSEDANPGPATPKIPDLGRAPPSARLPGKTKYEAAVKLAEILPVLVKRLPKIWETEAERMSIFDALGFAITARGKAARETRK
jgi:hypothetical protein